MYELDKSSLDDFHKEWCNREFESELKNIYNMKILNDMNHIHNKEGNNIYELNLLHDISNPSKRTKNINRPPLPPHSKYMYEYT